MIGALLRILALTRKELLAVLKDPRSRMSLLVPAMVECVIFGYAATYDLSDVPYALVDEDRSAASRELVAGLDGSGVFRRVLDTQRMDDVRRLVDEGGAVLAVRVGPEFGRDLAAGRTADVQVIADGRNSNTAATATSYVHEVVAAFNARHAARRSVPAGDEAAADAGGAADPSPTAATPPPVPSIRLVTRAWYNPNLESRWNMVPALIGTLTMLQTLLLVAMSVAREREQGTFDQLLVTPFTPAEIMAGKALPAVLVGLVQAMSVLAIAEFWFHVPFAGSFVVLFGGLVLFLVAAVGLGLLVSSFATTMQQAMLFSFVVMMPFLLLSGLTTPVRNMPPALQAATLLNPLRYAIEIARRVYLEGAGFTALSSQMWPLAVIGAVTLTAAAFAFRRRLA